MNAACQLGPWSLPAYLPILFTAHLYHHFLQLPLDSRDWEPQGAVVLGAKVPGALLLGGAAVPGLPPGPLGCASPALPWRLVELSGSSRALKVEAGPGAGRCYRAQAGACVGEEG